MNKICYKNIYHIPQNTYIFCNSSMVINKIVITTSDTYSIIFIYIQQSYIQQHIHTHIVKSENKNNLSGLYMLGNRCYKVLQSANPTLKRIGLYFLQRKKIKRKKQRIL